MIKKRTPNFTEYQLKELKILYLRGMTITNLAKKYRKDMSAIHRVLDKLFGVEGKKKIKKDLDNGIKAYLSIEEMFDNSIRGVK